MTLCQLVYVSAAVKPFSVAELTALLSKARSRNTPNQISGVLLHQSGSFLQVLEGESEAVDATYTRISKDLRHGKVTLLLRQTIAKRNFSDWSMGFVDVSGKADLLPGFRKGMAFSDLVGNREALMKVVGEFRAGRWRTNVS